MHETYHCAAYAARYTPVAGWISPATLLTSGALRKPRLATSANGIAHVVWDGERGDVLAARFEYAARQDRRSEVTQIGLGLFIETLGKAHAAQGGLVGVLLRCAR